MGCSIAKVRARSVRIDWGKSEVVVEYEYLTKTGEAVGGIVFQPLSLPTPFAGEVRQGLDALRAVLESAFFRGSGVFDEERKVPEGLKSEDI